MNTTHKQQMRDEFHHKFLEDGTTSKAELKLRFQVFLNHVIDKTISLCKSAVPEESKRGHWASSENAGFNTCRSQTLQALEEIK